ncbi:longitudinals lacking protein-like [Andrena cerasifolii]|uniref:longitudinals lacking protein-like n=1 Tax=Andrena cerasifolii TaxID=2819439 RepID=UPI00403774BB
MVYACGPCGKSFKWRKSLLRHEREECGKKPYRCPHCQRVMNLKDSLIRHLRLKHGQDCRVRRRIVQRPISHRAESRFAASMDGEIKRLPKKRARKSSLRH